MNNVDFFESHLGTTRTVAILRGYTREDTVRHCLDSWASGIDLVEVPIQGSGAWQSLEAAVEAGISAARIVGAGSLRSPRELDRAQATGASFGVSPGISEELLVHASKCDFPMLPGVASASEIMLALSCGATWLKAFPASVLGYSWLQAQLAIFPDAKLIATGGVTAQNANGFLAAGCRGLGTSAPTQVAAALFRDPAPIQV